MNPFRGTRMPIDSRNRMIGREDVFEELQMKMENHSHTVIMGVEGSGKSSLLKSFFNREYCMKMAKEERTLIMQTEYPVDVSSDKVYKVFIDRAQDALILLDICGMTEDKKNIEEYLAKTVEQEGGSRFEGTVNSFAARGFRLVYVLDNFERFTTSPQVTMEHHEKMRSLLDKTQYVVATNYDFNKDSLPPEVQSSYLLQMFANNEITLQGFSLEESEQYIRRELKSNDFEFPQSLIEEVYAISGGIPGLLHNAAYHAYDRLEQEDIESIKGTDIPKKIFADMQKTMENWSVLLTPNQVRVLKELKDKGGRPGEGDDSAAKLLLQRGILREVFRINERGRKVRESGVYDYNSVLFSQFCDKKDAEGHTLMEKAVCKNPFRKKKEVSLVESKETENPLAEGFPEGAQIVINGDVFMTGANQNNTNNTNNTDIHVEQMTLLQSLGNEQQFLATVEQIVGRLADDSRFRIDRTLTQEQLDERCDQMAEEIVGEIVPRLPTKEEMQTLDERFLEVRSRGVRTEVTDTFLGSLSEECGFYLKIAIVVEDALKALDMVNLGDFSAQLVMYGKVLEQCLRDNMYLLFSTERTLKDWDLYAHKKNVESRNRFGAMRLTQTFIGNYVHLITDKKNYLSQLCNNKSVEDEETKTHGPSEWNSWWEKLSGDVDVARTCRNSADHAGSKSKKDDLTVMCDLLFGDKGILTRCSVAKRLYDKITPQ